MNLLLVKVFGLSGDAVFSYCKLAAVPRVGERIVFRGEGVRRVVEVTHVADPMPADEVADIIVE